MKRAIIRFLARHFGYVVDVYWEHEHYMHHCFSYDEALEWAKQYPRGPIVSISEGRKVVGIRSVSFN